jgi:hypothetical protein
MQAQKSRSMFKALGLAAAVAMALTIAFQPVGLLMAAGTRIYLDPTPLTLASVGAQGVTEVKVENVSNLAGVEFHITFDPAQLQVVSTAAGALFNQNGVPMPLIPTYDNAAGKVDFVGAVVPPAVPYSGAAPIGVGSITWKLVSCPASGQIPLTLISTKLSDPNGAAITHTRSDGSIACTTPPAAPSNLTATPKGSDQIDLAWTDNANNEDGFQIERCTPDGCANFAPIKTVPANTTAFSDKGLTADTSYCYRVRAHNAAGDSGYSNTACAKTEKIKVSGIVLLQGRSKYAGTRVYLTEDACPSVQALSVKEIPGLPNVLTGITDDQGKFEIVPLVGKTYQCLLATHDMYLVARKVYTAPGDQGTVTLLGGNVVPDKSINIFDLARIANAIGGTDAAVDINADGKVDVYDLTIAAGNFGKEGPLPW